MILSNRHLTIKLSLEVFGLILLVLTVIPPLRCVLKRDSSIPCMVHNLSFPPRQSVNDGIKPDTYLDAPFKLHLPGLDKLVEFINLKGVGCLVFTRDLTHAYQKIPVDPHDYPLLGFTVNGQFYFHTVMPFRLHLATLECQHTTRAILRILSQQGIPVDVYIDDFYGTDTSENAVDSFSCMAQLPGELG